MKLLGHLRPRTSDEIAGSRWGVSCHWIIDPHELSTVQRVQQVAAIGAKWAVLCPDWDRIETEKGKYDFNSAACPLDDAVQAMVRAKVQPIIQIYGGNRLYMPMKLDPNSRQLADGHLLLDDREVQEAWHRYLDALARRYREHVPVWEIWNEPNSGAFWQRDGRNYALPVADYGRVVKQAADVIRRVQPEAVIIAGSTAHVPFDYLKGFLSSVGAKSFDHWSVHPYGELPESKETDIRQAQRILADARRPSALWQSECGFPSSGDTGGWGWGGPWDETKQAKWVLRRLLSDAAFGMEGSIYFVLNDYPAMIERGPDRGTMGVNRKGLYRFQSWEPKQSAYAFRHLASLIDDRLEPNSFHPSFSFESKSDAVFAYTLQEKANGSPVVVYWLAVPIETDFAPGTVQISLSDSTIEDPVLVDLLDGRVYEVAVANDQSRAAFDNLPVADSPFVLCSRRLLEIAADTSPISAPTGKDDE